MSMNNLEAYELIEEKNISDINAKGYLLRHKKTGARVCCLANDDKNKVFYIGFRTPPEDSTGVAHINEHSVLCGSKKYPAKDPFVELAKGSLNTFLNAMTYPDKTVYPVASCNDQDFANLMDVYLDAVFYPNIYSKPEIFKQEGWHYEIESPESDITLNGVVYSEMKGAFSSPDDVFDRIILDSLFPDNCYGVESGGDPDDIPKLTYEQFLDFHRKYYHPSNSYIYLYGDMDFESKLEYIDREYLNDFDRLEIDSSIKMQKAFTETAVIKKSYSITADEPMDDNTYLAYNTVIDTSLNDVLYIAFQVIDYALISAPGAVLKQALLDKGICKDVQSMYDNGVLQPYFSISIKNSNESCKDDFVDVIKKTLEKVVEEGFDKKSLRAGLNILEFKFREADFGHYPKGLMYGLQAMDSWIYDDNKPFIHLEAIHTFEYLKELIETDYFEKLIKKYILDNKHTSIVIMTPEVDLTAKNDRLLAEKLQEYKDSLSDKEINSLVKATNDLKRYQEEPDPEEVIAKIPLLKISDINKEAEKYIYEVHKREDAVYVTHDIFTGGIGYLKIGFDISELDYEYLPYLGILKAVLGMVNTGNYSYAELANEIFLNSGGWAANTLVNVNAKDTSKFRLIFETKSKVLYDKLDFSFDIIKEILLSSDFEDRKRIKELICSSKSKLQGAMMSSGHSVSAHRALSHVSNVEEILEMISGIEMYRLIEEIESDFDNKVDGLIEKLTYVAGMIISKKNLIYIDYTATSDQYDYLFMLGKKFTDALPDEGLTAKGEVNNLSGLSLVNEGFKTSAKVQYVSKAGKYMDEEHPYTGALKVLKVIMGYDYLWNNIRVKGGAYGAFASFYRTGEGCFSSYRDPNLANTLKIYDNTVSYLENFDANEREMTKFIIGTIADMDIPLTPSAKGSSGLDAYLSEDTDENVQRERDEVLGTTKEIIRGLAGYVKNIIDSSNICVVGSAQNIENESRLFDVVEPLFKS